MTALVPITLVNVFDEEYDLEVVLAPILRGEQGIPGDGMPAGGTTGQVLAKASADDFDLEWVDQTGGGGAGATNLAYTASPTGGTVTSDTGTDATIPLADATNAGLMTPAEKTKLSNTSGTNTGDQDLSGYSPTSHNHTGVYDPAGTASATLSAHTGAADPHSQYALESTIGAAGGIAPLDGAGKVAAAYLPSYVDDVVEAANFAALPGTGETGKIYITLDDGKAWRWGGSAYAEISASPGSTDAVTEGSTNLYHTASRVLGQVLTGLSTAAGTVVEATHTILQAIGFLQKQVSDNTSAISGKQATLVSGTNIKTVNSTSLLGSGDLTITSGVPTTGGTITDTTSAVGGSSAGSALTVNQTWNTTGTPTAIKVNVTDTASASASLLADLQVGGASRFSVTKDGLITAANNLVLGSCTFSPSGVINTYDNAIGSSGGNVGFTSNSGGKYAWAFRSGTLNLQGSSDAAIGWTGTVAATNQNGPNGTVDIALVRNAAGVVEINSGTAGTYRDLKLRNLISSGGVVTLASFTVATLPSASTSGAGATAYVTDSNATTYRATVAGGGSDKVTVTSDGTNWIITG